MTVRPLRERGADRTDSRPEPGRPSASEKLPRHVLVILAVLAAAAAGASVVAVGIDPHPLRWPAVALVAVGIAVGDALSVDLSYRRGAEARFGLSDTALAAALLAVPPTEVVLGAALGIAACQLIERTQPVKSAFNTLQYTAGAAVAAVIVQLVAPRPGPVTLLAFAAVALGGAAFMATTVVSVSAVLAATTGRPPREVARSVLPTSALVAVGSTGLGLLIVLLEKTHPWALPALAVPLLLLYSSSRQEVRAQVDRGRSTNFVALDQRLGGITRPEAVGVELVAGVGAIVGCRAAVWRGDGWATPVPVGSGPCPIDPELSVTLVTRGSILGPAVDGRCAAIGLGGGGVLVAWAGELDITDETEEWLERLGRSGRAHFERVAAQTALEQERAILRAVVDGTADGIYVADHADVLQLWNPGMASLATVASDAALGRPAADVLGPGPWTTPGVHDVVRAEGENERVWRVSVTAVRDEALLRALHRSPTDQGHLCVAVVHDVSAERRLARMKDDMLAVVSHELRTPLTPIKASAQMLRRGWDRLDPATREDLLATVERRADHLARLVEDLLLVGQLSSDRPDAGPRVRPAAVDLAALVRENGASLALSHPDHHLVVAAPDALPTTTDRLRIRQILDNLVDNACKFSREGTTVDVVLAADGGEAVLRVTDEGRGIPSEDLDRVLGRFERVEDPLRMTTSGAGLGLYIVDQLVRALGGRLSLDSRLDVGTTVTVRLPTAGPGAGGEPGAETAATGPGPVAQRPS